MADTVFTKKYDDFNGQIITQEQIRYNGKCKTVNALWDTGSTYTCVSEELIKELSMV